MRNDIMVDLETLGVKDGATIFQIAAASFDLKTGEIHDEIDLKLNISKVEDLQVDGSTLKWWLNTDKKLLTKLLHEGELTEAEMFTQFANWLGKHKSPKLWGNGILFDNAKIKQKFESMGLVYPVFYQHDRDVRTILDLASSITGLSEREIRAKSKRDTDHDHNAIDDVRKQIRLVHYCYNLIKGRTIL